MLSGPPHTHTNSNSNNSMSNSQQGQGQNITNQGQGQGQPIQGVQQQQPPLSLSLTPLSSQSQSTTTPPLGMAMSSLQQQQQQQQQQQSGSNVVSECFTVGSWVWCRTCIGHEIEGEVQAYETNTKMLVLKNKAASGRHNLHDVNIVNLSLVSDVHIKRDANTVAEPPLQALNHALNLHLLDRRCRNTIDDKKRLVSAMTCDDPDGQRLFLTIAKTIKDVFWSGQNIRVFNQLMITPPYKVENICGDPDSKEYVHIKKVVERHMRERSAQQNSGVGGGGGHNVHEAPPVSAAASVVTTTRPGL